MEILYPALKLTHIFALLAFFAAEGMSQIYTRDLGNSANLPVFRSHLGKIAQAVKVIKASLLLVLLSGLIMTFTTWGFKIAWVDLSLVIFLLSSLSSQFVDAPRLKEIAQIAFSSQGEIPQSLWQKLSDPVLNLTAQIRFGAALGLVFLMTAKPGLWVGILGVVVTVVLVLVVNRMGQPQAKGQAVGSR